FSLPELPYAHDALEPHIDGRTMEIHHGKHHAGYTSKLNAALEGHGDLASKDITAIISNLEAVPADIRTSGRNNGGRYYNRLLCRQMMATRKGGTATADIGSAIYTRWGSFDAFKTAFANTAATRFGSGWGWLVLDRDGNLEVLSTPNQDNPLS